MGKWIFFTDNLQALHSTGRVYNNSINQLDNCNIHINVHIELQIMHD